MFRARRQRQEQARLTAELLSALRDEESSRSSHSDALGRVEVAAEQAVKHAADASEQVQTSAALIEKALQNFQRPPILPTMLMIVVGVLAAIAGSFWSPPDRTPPAPSSGLAIDIELGSLDLDRVSVDIQEDSPNRWQVRIDAYSHGEPPEDWVPRLKVGNYRSDLVPTPCNEVPARNVEICEESDAKPSSGVIRGQNPPEFHSVTSRGYWFIDTDANPTKRWINGAGFLVWISGTKEDLGIASTDDLTVLVSQPRISDGRSKAESTMLPVRAIFGLKELGEREWSGLPPDGVGTERVSWSYTTSRENPGLNLSTGTNRSVLEDDKRRSFIGGILFGLAVSAVVAAAQYALTWITAVRSRRT